MNPQSATNTNTNTNTVKFRIPQFILAGSILAAVSVFAVSQGEDHTAAPKPAIVLDAKPLSRDAKLRQRMGEAGRERVMERFTQAAMAGKHIQLYERILADRR